MKQIKQISAVAFLGFALALSGCNQTTKTRYEAPQPVVVTSYQNIEVPFAYGTTTLDANAQQALDGFVLNHDVRDGDDILIEVVGQEGSKSYERAQVVGAYLKRLDLTPRLIRQKEATDVLNLQSVKIKLARYSVQVPDCPNWTDSAEDNYANSLSSNFGCAHATNLALMVADPRDLLRGRELAPADGVFMANTLGLYQRSEGMYLESRKLTTTE